MTSLLDEPALRLIEEHVRRLFVSMGFDEVSIRCRCSETSLAIDVEAGNDGKLLIGAHGAHLRALQHLIQHVLRSQVPAGVRPELDINGYQAHRQRSLLSLAEIAARRATTQGQAVILQPMSPAERRYIHTSLASRSDIRTESTGEEPNRRIVIKPVFL